VGFDDIPEAGYMRPRLTTVRQPLQEMGRRATQLLLACIEAPDRPTEQIQLPTVLVVRESTAVVWAGGET
jgi:DNA-binding LacI/PurR family transcriptional regulator